jgi:hypothetical protein
MAPVMRRLTKNKKKGRRREAALVFRERKPS